MPQESSVNVAQNTVFTILFSISVCHFFNDIMQSMLMASYPMIKENYQLSFVQIGLITATYQVIGSILQPAIGFYTDKKVLPYALIGAMCSTFIGLVFIAFAHHYGLLLLGAAFIGLGSSIFHPEASRVTRLAAGQNFGAAQSIFQVGGNAGSAIGPLLAAYLITRQENIFLFALLAFAGIIILTFVCRWYANNIKSNKRKNGASYVALLPASQIKRALIILVLLMIAKYIYMAFMSNYFTFYVIEKFGLDTSQAQILLFCFLGGIAVGTIFGGPIGDRIGARTVIWVSIIGILPFTLILPYVNLPWTIVLSILIGTILASAFPAMITFAQEMLPGRVGTIAGLFFGLSFGTGALSAAGLGFVIEHIGVITVFKLCSVLPFLGFVAILLPHLPSRLHQT